jgi:hypothetical protein
MPNEVSSTMRLFLLTFLFALLSACNYRAELPSYIYIMPFELQTNRATEGSASRNIPDAWVYLDDEALGVFQLPARVPVISKGPASLLFMPGIKKDGISGIREVYPFYTHYSIDFSPSPATVDTVFPSLKYIDGLNFPLLEDFEIGNDFSNMNRTSIRNEVFEGNWSGVVRLDVFNNELATSSSAFQLPQDGRRIFLEMDYKCSLRFNVSLLAGKNTGLDPVYAVTITSKDQWNKIYIDLTEEVIANKARDYRLVFSSKLPAGVDEATFFFDNIKIVHL